MPVCHVLVMPSVRSLKVIVSSYEHLYVRGEQVLIEMSSENCLCSHCTHLFWMAGKHQPNKMNIINKFLKTVFTANTKTLNNRKPLGKCPIPQPKRQQYTLVHTQLEQFRYCIKSHQENSSCSNTWSIPWLAQCILTRPINWPLFALGRKNTIQKEAYVPVYILTRIWTTLWNLYVLKPEHLAYNPTHNWKIKDRISPWKPHIVHHTSPGQSSYHSVVAELNF